MNPPSRLRDITVPAGTPGAEAALLDLCRQDRNHYQKKTKPHRVSYLKMLPH